MRDEDLSDEDDVAFSPSSYDNGWSGSPSSASPGLSQYMYDRTRTTNVASFVSGKNTKPSPLQKQGFAEDEQETILNSLVSQVLDVVGDQFDEEEAQKALKLNNNNVDKAVNYLLEQTTSSNTKDDLFEMEIDQPKPSQTKEPKRAVNFAESTKETITPFKFDTPSPDDVVQNARKQAVKQKKTGEAPKPSPAPAQQPVSHLSDDLSGMNLGEFSDAPKQPAFKKEALTPVAPVAVKDEVAELKSIDKKQAKQMTPARRKEIEELIKARSHEKPHLNLVVVGHVDAGKSTLMGHLLYDIGLVSQKLMHKYEKESKNIGKASFSYAWVLDEHEEERNRGITMDIGVTNFETNSRKITLLDAPGHRDFVPNMITGAAQADVALLVIDATTDGFEKGFDSDGQTKEHALLVRSLGVSQLGVAINKLDTVDWSKERYDFIVNKLGQFLKTSGFSGQSVWFVPCSGLTGENLVKSGEAKLKSWYQGPTLLEKIDNFPLPQRENDKPFRLCISDIYKAQALGVTIGGKIEAGIVSVGDKLLLMPLNEICVVKGIRVHGETTEFATAGENVDIGLTGLEIQTLSVGNFLCAPENPIPLATRFRAKVITFSLQKPILKGQISELHYLTVNEPCNVSALIAVLDRSTGEVKKKNPRSLGDNTSAIVEITTPKPICIELKSSFNQIGRFTLREHGRSIAAGIVTEIL